MHMHGETYSMRQIRLKRERGRRMAQARWKADRERRETLAAMEPLRACEMGRKLMQRVVVIGADQRAVEICRWSDTSAREWAALKRRAGL